MGTTRNTVGGIQDRFPNLLDRLKFLGSSEQFTILIVTGTYGTYEGISGFTRKDLLHDKSYLDTCRMVGVEPQDTKTNPEMQIMDMNAVDGALLRDPSYKNIKFNVLNIKYFYEDENGLLNYVSDLYPMAIILSWVHIKNNDVAKLLIKTGIVAQMSLQCERTAILGMSGETWINLDKEQTGYLRNVAKGLEEGDLRNFFIAGAPGTGKTLLGVETTKLVMDELKSWPQGLDLFVLDAAEDTTEKTSLIQSIESMFKSENCVKHFYSLNKLQQEYKIDSFTSFEHVLRVIRYVLNTPNRYQKRNKVIFIDDFSPAWLSSYETEESNKIGDDKSTYTIACVTTAVSDNPHSYCKTSFNGYDETNSRQTLKQVLNINYRNTKRI